MTFDEMEEPLPWGLHDAYLEGMTLDWPNARLDMTVRLMMSEHQDMDQRWRITIRGLVYCVIDPPVDDSKHGYDPAPADGLWLDTGPGPANDAARDRLPPTPPGCFVQWFFVHDWNAFLHVCGRDVAFAWLEDAPVPARAGTRALFAGQEIPDP